MAAGPTILEALRDSLLSAARFNPNDMAPPAAVLWTDEDREWEAVIPHLQGLIRELLAFGEYRPEERKGPAIWLRCVIDGSLPEAGPPEKAVPVVYLPGVGRQMLRGAQDCPDDLKPLVELQYRGTCWTQRNGKDWTVYAFLVSSDGGLGLDIPRDAKTRHSMMTALAELVTRPASSFQGRRLEADDFDRLMVEDPVKDLLVWLNRPEETRSSWAGPRWEAFRSRCRAGYGFDPQKDGQLVGGEFLGGRSGGWAAVWDRLAEAPALYGNIPALLRRAEPAGQREMFEDRSSWPRHNEAMEDDLRKALLGLETDTTETARRRVFDLEASHGPRRDWVWSRLGEAPLANALRHLVTLAEATKTIPGGATPEAVADVYMKGAWKADAAVLDAIAAVKSSADWKATGAAVRSLYVPWLEKSAEHFQNAAETTPLPGAGGPGTEPLEAGDGCLFLFADGLRWDVARRLLLRMEARGWRVQMAHRWAGLPTVTATAKPAVSPVAGRLTGALPGEDFAPVIAGTGQTLNTPRFRKLLDAEGVAYIQPGETGAPPGAGWAEQGEFDALGHSLQAKLACRIGEQIDLLIERMIAFFDAGWKEIRVVTDHGWLLVPGGLPAVTLPRYLTESRWARCAAVKEGSKVACPAVLWYWNPAARVAIGPGIACFGKGHEYAHGGLSLQECLAAVITVTAGDGGITPASGITEVRWVGLRCRVKIEPPAKGLKVALRATVNDPGPGGEAAREVDPQGSASLLVADETRQGQPVVVVLLDARGNVIAKQATIIGGED